MLSLGRFRSRTCQGLTRRAVLQIGASSVFGLSLADLLRWRAEAGSPATGTAKSVLLLWLWGGPSQLDTWDPKPNAPLDYRGPFGTIAAKTTGLNNDQHSFCEFINVIGELVGIPSILVIAAVGINTSQHTGISGHL